MVVSAMPSPWVAVEAGTDLLARARQIQGSWDRLLGEGALGPELPPQATAGMRPMIVDSWRRVLATGLEPIDVLPSIEADPSETRERWLEHPLGLLRHVLVEPLQMLAVESNSVVQVTDPSGLTLYLGGPEWLKARAAEMNLVEGARCSETANGTPSSTSATTTANGCAPALQYTTRCRADSSGSLISRAPGGSRILEAWSS
jgi:transcriptional regulator of acetoin/glycerol metabolism